MNAAPVASLPEPPAAERSSHRLADLPAVVIDPGPGRRARLGIPPDVRPEQGAPDDCDRSPIDYILDE